DQAIALAGADRERDAAQHLPVDAAHAVGDIEVGDGQGVDGFRHGLCAHSANALWIPSATRFTATTSDAIATAGPSDSHQNPAEMSAQASLIWAPQSGAGGCGPNPRNDRVATAKTA